MDIRCFGTATLSFKSGDDSILFDPFLPLNSKLPAPAVEELAALGDIFITHGHFDHLMHVPQVVRAGEATVYCCKTAAESLYREGVAENRVVIIKPGDKIEKGPFEITVFKGLHIRFDLPLIIKTLFSRRCIRNRSALKELLRESKLYPEGEVLVYQVAAGGKTVLHMGSLNLDSSEQYPAGPASPDLLTLPFQGRSDLNSYALQFIERLKPKALYLHHFDDAFPPVSSPVDTASFIEIVAREYPELPVIVPAFKKAVTV